MTKDQKDLLMKDLCSRLPYGVKMNHIADDEHSPKTLIGIAKDMITLESSAGYSYVDIEHYKPYLFPMTSMTEEQVKELEKLYWYCDYYEICNDTEYVYHNDCFNLIEWLNKNHFDYIGLIPMGLANDATGLNIYS